MKLKQLLLASVLFLSAPVLGAINIGDTPQIQFTAVDGSHIDIAKLKGKLVIVDMWATWCGPCMAEAPHMVKINQTYGDKGLQMIGISLDQDKAQMVSVAKEKGFTWPQYFDGQVWQNKYAQQFSVSGIPFTMLIGPDSKILWMGDPGLIDEPLAHAFKDHPPQLVDPAVLATANDILTQIKEKLVARDTKGAIALMAKIPPAAKLDPAFASNAQEAMARMESVAKSMLAEVQPMIDAKQYTEAAQRFKQLGSALAGTPSGESAVKMLSALKSNPDAKKAMAEQERQANAQAVLETAQKLQSEKKDALAYPQFKHIVASFPGTDAAATAAKAVAVYEQDTVLVTKINSDSMGKKAKALLSMAKSYVDSGENDLAIKKYQQVVQQFAGSEYASTAQKALDDLGAAK